MSAEDLSARPVRSMTGFAHVRQQTSLGELRVSLRTVNHRALDFHFHQSSELQVFENAARSLLKQQIGRGHVEVRISLARAETAGGGEYNHEIVARYVAAFRKAAAEFGVDSEPDLNAALRLPDALSLDGLDGEVDQAYESEVLAVLSQCATELNSFRAREGGELAEALRNETRQIQERAAAMRAIRKNALPEMHKRLLERLKSLLGDVGVDARRLAEEAAILADRSDVEEELARLEIHASQLLEMLKQGGETGKRVDFLLQEMNRETNTILSKTSGIGEAGLTMSDLALATKANIERIREQALNIE